MRNVAIATATVWAASSVMRSSSAFAPSSSFISGGSGATSPRVRDPNRPYHQQQARSRLLRSSSDETSETDNNPFAFLSSLFTTTKAKPTPVETEEEREARLRQERRDFLAAGEVLRQDQVKEDALPYLFLFALQFLPLLSLNRASCLVYFLGVAVTTVYVGGRQVTLEPPEQVSKESALYAPVGASVSIGVLYLFLKSGVDPTVLYAVAVSLFGVLSISDVGVPLLRNLFPALATAELPVSRVVADKLGLEAEDEPTLPLDGLLALGLGVLCTAVYWAPVAMTHKYITSNIIAWALAMVSLGSISLGSFQTATILLAGLFFYDIFWVFGTDVMMTVATKIEAPVKFLFKAPDVPGVERAYPFSVLGLGDVVIPGLFVRFMSIMDDTLRPTKVSYFNTGTAAYAVGLSACFVVNEITKAGQPALLYLDPACIGSALLAAAYNGQLNEVWNFEEEKPEVEEVEA